MTASLEKMPMLPDDVFVIDPVIHALNLSARDNVASKYGEQLHAMSYGLHAMLSPPDALCERAVYMTDMPPEALVRTISKRARPTLLPPRTLRL